MRHKSKFMCEISKILNTDYFFLVRWGPNIYVSKPSTTHSSPWYQLLKVTLSLNWVSGNACLLCEGNKFLKFYKYDFLFLSVNLQKPCLLKGFLIPNLNSTYIPNSTEDQGRSLHKILSSTCILYISFYKHLFCSFFKQLWLLSNQSPSHSSVIPITNWISFR